MHAQYVLTILAVDNLPKASNFYEGAFAFAKLVDTPSYIEFSAPGGMRLGLYDRAGFALNVNQTPSRTPSDSITSTELYFYVDDLLEAERRLQNVGARLLSARSLRDWGDEATYYADPDGNVVVVALRH